MLYYIYDSAPVLAGLDKSYLVVMILSMNMLRDVVVHKEAYYINAMIEYVFSQKVMTYDLCRHDNKYVKYFIHRSVSSLF